MVVTTVQIIVSVQPVMVCAMRFEANRLLPKTYQNLILKILSIPIFSRVEPRLGLLHFPNGI